MLRQSSCVWTAEWRYLRLERVGEVRHPLSKKKYYMWSFVYIRNKKCVWHRNLWMDEAESRQWCSRRTHCWISMLFELKDSYINVNVTEKIFSTFFFPSEWTTHFKFHHRCKSGKIIIDSLNNWMMLTWHFEPFWQVQLYRKSVISSIKKKEREREKHIRKTRRSFWTLCTLS